MAALRCPSFTHIPIEKPSLINKPIISRFMMLRHEQNIVKRTRTVQIRSSSNKKVFEDQSAGIVCYRDDKGEIVCEGYDEGPRIHQGLSALDYYHISELRDAEIIELLQQNWLQIAKDGEKGLAIQEDFNWNGFNKFC